VAFEKPKRPSAQALEARRMRKIRGGISKRSVVQLRRRGTRPSEESENHKRRRLGEQLLAGLTGPARKALNLMSEEGRLRVLKQATASAGGVEEVTTFRVRRLENVQREVSDRMVRLKTVVGVGLQVDDVLVEAHKKVLGKWMRYLLWYLFTQAELVTNMRKNQLMVKDAVEFNGFVFDKVAASNKEIFNEADQKGGYVQLLKVQMRDRTRRKLEAYADEWREGRTGGWHTL